VSSRFEASPRKSEGDMRLNRSDEELMEIVARLPLIPTACLLTLARGKATPRTTYGRISRLCERGVLRRFRAPAEGSGPPPYLFLVSDAGFSAVARRRGIPVDALGREWACDRAAVTSVLRWLRSALCAYALLQALALTGRGPVRLSAWWRSWRRHPLWSGTGRPGGGIWFPAFAALVWEQGRGEYLLIPDTGGLPLRAFQTQLAHIGGRTAVERLPTLVVATTSSKRVRAWSNLVERMIGVRVTVPFEVEVDTWEGWWSRARTAPPGVRTAPMGHRIGVGEAGCL
jgi:hypothetical protein